MMEIWKHYGVQAGEGSFPGGGSQHFPLDNYVVIAYHVGMSMGQGRFPAGAHGRVTK